MDKDVEYRLVRHLSYQESEMQDYGLFAPLSWVEYSGDRSKRRNVERWVEGIVNSSVDIAKIILVSRGMTVPGTYREIVEALAAVPGFPSEALHDVGRWVRLRNVISHEYLDIKWNSIRQFIDESQPNYKRFLTAVKALLAAQKQD